MGADFDPAEVPRLKALLSRQQVFDTYERLRTARAMGVTTLSLPGMSGALDSAGILREAALYGALVDLYLAEEGVLRPAAQAEPLSHQMDFSRSPIAF